MWLFLYLLQEGEALPRHKGNSLITTSQDETPGAPFVGTTGTSGAECGLAFPPDSLPLQLFQTPNLSAGKAMLSFRLWTDRWECERIPLLQLWSSGNLSFDSPLPQLAFCLLSRSSYFNPLLHIGLKEAACLLLIIQYIHV